MEKEKQIKYAKVFALIAVVLLLIVVLIPANNGEHDYKIRKEEVNVTGIKTTIEVVLKQKEPTEKIEEISKYFREKYKTENVFIFFFLTDTDKYNYAYAGWHRDKPEKILIFEREKY